LVDKKILPDAGTPEIKFGCSRVVHLSPSMSSGLAKAVKHLRAPSSNFLSPKNCEAEREHTTITFDAPATVFDSCKIFIV